MVAELGAALELGNQLQLVPVMANGEGCGWLQCTKPACSSLGMCGDNIVPTMHRALPQSPPNNREGNLLASSPSDALSSEPSAAELGELQTMLAVERQEGEILRRELAAKSSAWAHERTILHRKVTEHGRHDKLCQESSAHGCLVRTTTRDESLIEDQGRLRAELEMEARRACAPQETVTRCCLDEVRGEEGSKIFAEGQRELEEGHVCAEEVVAPESGCWHEIEESLAIHTLSLFSTFIGGPNDTRSELERALDSQEGTWNQEVRCALKPWRVRVSEHEHLSCGDACKNGLLKLESVVFATCDAEKEQQDIARVANPCCSDLSECLEKAESALQRARQTEEEETLRASEFRAAASEQRARVQSLEEREAAQATEHQRVGEELQLSEALAHQERGRRSDEVRAAVALQRELRYWLNAESIQCQRLHHEAEIANAGGTLVRPRVILATDGWRAFHLASQSSQENHDEMEDHEQKKCITENFRLLEQAKDHFQDSLGQAEFAACNALRRRSAQDLGVVCSSSPQTSWENAPFQSSEKDSMQPLSAPALEAEVSTSRRESFDIACSWHDVSSPLSDFGEYVRFFCPGLDPKKAECLARDGELLLVSMCRRDFVTDVSTAQELVQRDPARAVSAVIWALMAKALRMRQGFTKGTFVLHGAGADRIFFTLLPYLNGRGSSHFREKALPLSEGDAEELPEGEARTRVLELASRALRTHFGIDTRDLPAGHQHVVLARIRMHDGSVGVYVKPEEHGCDVSSAEQVKETILHGCNYLKSQFERRWGDARAHDEGEHKRKEHVPLRCQRSFSELRDGLQAVSDELREAQPELGDMARRLRSSVGWAVGARALLAAWEDEFGPSLDLRHGNEVLICTLDLFADLVDLDMSARHERARVEE
eukprot:TRINITY_DN29301_c0_g1_i1.p1 TRINITY_DN29301_c0_g1~~TRINITY_DN29301_c0_g1_i1.p1  ORF type:complete len:1045 (+),score=168.06 TRINITY_DN29301_c0_g1_i1:467-3136(+)